MTDERQLYLAKAQESLASAYADLEAGRYNSVANRAYYAVFQAAVAMLIATEIRPRRASWEHKFVMSEFSGKLVSRRKVVPARFRRTLADLLDMRLVADYRARNVTATEARKAAGDSSALVSYVASQLQEDE